jgi:hypothetical protein
LRYLDLTHWRDSTPPFGFDSGGKPSRKLWGRRLGVERRRLPERRIAERRVIAVPVTVERRRGERRSGVDRRSGLDRRQLGNRRRERWLGIT